MGTERRFGTRVLFAALLGCVVVCATPTAALADPVYKARPCVVQSIQKNDGPTIWQVKGTVEVTNIPKDAKQVQAKLRIERKAKGDRDWTTVTDVTLTTSLAPEPMVLDTGFHDLKAAPGPNDEFRIVVVTK